MASKTEEILIAIAEIKKDTAEIFRRLDKINGSIEDYPVVKNKVYEIEKDIIKITGCIDELKKLLNGIKVKVWGLAGLIGAIMGFVGVIIGKFIS